VSRNSEISLQCYLRSGDGPRAGGGAGGSGNADAKDGQGDDVMGVSDIYLGGVKWVPDFDNQVSGLCYCCRCRTPCSQADRDSQRTTDEWYPVSGGSGQIHVHVSYQSDHVSAEPASQLQHALTSLHRRPRRSPWTRSTC